jgi:hypothetical protein
VSRRKASGPSVSFFAFQDIITSVVGIFVLITLIMMVELVQRKGSTPASTKLLEDSHSSVIADLMLQVEKLESRSKKLDSISTKIGSVQVFNKDEIAKELRASIQSLNEQIERTDQRKREIQRIIDSQIKLQASLQSETVQRSRDREELAKLLKELERLDSKIGELDSDAPLIFKSKSLDGRTVVVVDVARDETVLLDLDADRRTTIRGKDSEREFKNWIAKHSKGNFHYFLLIRPNGASNFDTLRSSLDESGASYGYDLLDQDRTIRLRSEVIK